MSKFIEVPFGSEGPKGEKGDAATVAVGTVTTLPAGSPATVENAGTSSAAVLVFGIPQGPKGDTGATGATGAKGPKGDTGATGATGAKGPKGDTGAAGADGKSAYQQAVEGGYTGTEAEFEALLAGIDGYLPKVFDGEQTVTPKTAGGDVVLNFDNNDEYQNWSCKAMLKIFESYGLQLHLFKDENGTWKSCGELRLGKDGEIKLTNLINSSEIKITDDGRIHLSTATGKDAYLNYRQILTAADKGVNGGVASLGNDGKVPAAQLPPISGAPTITYYKNNTGTTVTIADTSAAALVKVYKNGLLLEPTEDYSISGTTLTMVTALVATDKVALEVF